MPSDQGQIDRVRLTAVIDVHPGRSDHGKLKAKHPTMAKRYERAHDILLQAREAKGPEVTEDVAYDWAVDEGLIDKETQSKDTFKDYLRRYRKLSNG
jgi:hypothetical protein